MGTTWGKSITHDQTAQPIWIALDDKVNYSTRDDLGFIHHSVATIIPWSVVKQYRLHADHWAYPVLAANLTPWAGGETAPGDWDGSPCMLRDGLVRLTDDTTIYEWGRHRIGKVLLFDIIGYKRRALADGGFVTSVPVGAIPVIAANGPECIMPHSADYNQARRLLEALQAKHFPNAPTISGVLDQIDNLTTTLARRETVIKECIEALPVGEKIIPGKRSVLLDCIEALQCLLPQPPVTPVEQLARELFAAANPDARYGFETVDKAAWLRIAQYVLDRKC